ncbi:AT-hook motif nuclear-localized protein 11 [Brassica rapa]|uniref:AT-hook motif nuclear-localized protein 11 n=1 Tax=Brassica campestris TaxID=3711 RepID=UPI0004F18457|nr:AT-hook motif nuclear-localized protein 11 [Brassica rapa]
MDQREAMALSGSGYYYIQRGMPGSAPPQTQPSFYGSQGFQQFSNPSSPFGSTGFVYPPLPVETSQVDSLTPVALPPSGETFVKRKRGRPRKYGQDGSVSLALSPSLSSSMSPNSNKRGRGRPPGSGKKQRLSSTGGVMPWGTSFTPHVIVVSVGEDIASKVMSFSQQSPRAICVLSVTGAVSTATILQRSLSHGAIKYEGRFELLSLSTSYPNATDNDYPNSTVNLAVSLACPDYRVIGGGVGGPLIAASSVQVIIGSYIWAIPKGKIKKRDEDVQETDALDDNTAATSPDVPQQSHNLVQTPVGMWSTGSRSMDMHHAHMDIDLMRG